jgi:hypothetical protein
LGGCGGYSFCCIAQQLLEKTYIGVTKVLEEGFN